MTSVQNHRPRLNGNSLLILLLGLLLIAGCTASKKTQKRTQQTDQTEHDDTPRVYNPATGKYEPVEDPGALVDTIEFIEDKAVEPVGTIDAADEGKKEIYDLTVMMPFGLHGSVPSMETIDPGLRRFMHYYAGVRMALSALEREGITCRTHVYDCGETVEATEKILRSLKTPDAIIGPYDMGSLNAAAKYAQKTGTPVFSPWTPSIPLDDNNPYFVQLNPGLEAHAKAITDYIDTKFAHAKVYLVARDDAREKARLSLFREARKERPGMELYEDLIITDKSASLSETHLERMLSPDTTTVFVLPYYSRSDEDFISAFLRKLHAEQGKSDAYVFGLPQWLTFNRIGADYLESARVHVSTAFFMDTAEPEVQEFQRNFLEQFGTVPEQPAYQGYTFTLFLGHALDRYGTGFLSSLVPMAYAEDGYRLEPIFRSKEPEKNNPVNYLENHNVQILRFQGHTFRPAY